MYCRCKSDPWYHLLNCWWYPVYQDDSLEDCHWSLLTTRVNLDMQCILVSCKSKPWYALLDCQYYAVPLLEMFVVEYKWLLTQKMFVVCQCYVSICWNVECLLADVDNTYHLSHFWLPIAHFYSEEIHTFTQQLTLFCNSLLYDGACQLWLLHAYPSIHNKSYS